MHPWVAGMSRLAWASAVSLTALFAARILAGISGASVGTASAYIADITPPENRSKRIGLIGAAFGVGFVLGPAIGGVFVAVNGVAHLPQGPSQIAFPLMRDAYPYQRNRSPSQDRQDRDRDDQLDECEAA